MQCFPPNKESEWLYKVYVKEEPRGSKAKTKRFTEIDPNETLIGYLKKSQLSLKEFSFELKISKHFKYEEFGLNQCSEYSDPNDKDVTQDRDYNIYDCLTLFSRSERLD